MRILWDGLRLRAVTVGVLSSTIYMFKIEQLVNVSLYDLDR
jgi:hypothetical protein